MNEITNIQQIAQTHGYLSHLRDINVLKALDGYGQTAQTLERQDLEGDMERLNILETPFYERLGKIKATALDHEYNIITSRQDKIGYACYRDGTVPREVEFEVQRRRILPTFIGHRITMTEFTLATTEHGVKQIEQVAKDEKIIAVMEETEYLLFHGDRRFGSNDLTSPSNLQFNGLERILKSGAPQNILDLGGKPLSLGALWAAENKVYQTQGLARPDTVFISPVDKINLQASFYNLARVTSQADRAAGVLGANAQSFISAFGESELIPSRFVGNFHRFTDQPAGNTSGDYARPLPSVVSTAVTEAIALEGLPTGRYQYAVKAANFNGEAQAVETGVVDVTGSTSQVRISLTSVHPSTKWHIVYRADVKADGSVGEYKFLKKVPYFGKGTADVVDDGHETLANAYGEFRYKKIPGTGTVFGVDMKTTNIAQWIGLELMPLPQTLNRDWAIRHVMSLFSRAPEFSYAIVNVSQDSIV